MNKKIIIICGPTASGKSAHAIDVAKAKKGAIINADSMQIYREIPILTASPSEEDKALVPHHLYNYISIKNSFSVVDYQKAALAKIAEVEAAGYLPIIVGGTGLYISALLKGLSKVPDIEPDIRQKARNLLKEVGNDAFHAKLMKVDPVVAAKLAIGDSQRMVRAYEIFLQTGKSITFFQQETPVSPLINYDIKIILISPERKILYKACDERFIKLVEKGALDEVRNAMVNANSKALGFAQLALHLRGEITLKEAIALAQTKTRQYAKRQVTWFTHQVSSSKKRVRLKLIK